MSIYLLGSSVVTLANISVFDGTPMSRSNYTGAFGSIFVPASLVAAYQSATNWATYKDRITAFVNEPGSEPPAANIISFTIDGITYQAEAGMTWQDWCDSDYNTGMFEANDFFVGVVVNGESYEVDDGSVWNTDTIDAGASYSAITNNFIINFTIDGKTYRADEGMTWSQWCNSSYNTGGYTIDANAVVLGGYAVSTKNSPASGVNILDVIISNTNYWHWEMWED